MTTPVGAEPFLVRFPHAGMFATSSIVVVLEEKFYRVWITKNDQLGSPEFKPQIEEIRE